MRSWLWWIPVLFWALGWTNGAREFIGDSEKRQERVDYLAEPLTTIASGDS